FVDSTGADGAYTILGQAGAGSAGANQLIAVSMTTDSTGSGGASLAAQDAIATVPLSMNPVALSVISVSPPPGATSGIVTTPITVSFSKPVSASSLTGSTFTVTSAAGNPVLGQISVLAGNRVGVFTPSSTLANGTTYRATIAASVQDLYGNPLGTAFTS